MKKYTWPVLLLTSVAVLCIAYFARDMKPAKSLWPDCEQCHATDTKWARSKETSVGAAEKDWHPTRKRKDAYSLPEKVRIEVVPHPKIYAELRDDGSITQISAEEVIDNLKYKIELYKAENQRLNVQLGICRRAMLANTPHYYKGGPVR